MKVYFVRHGESELNKESKHQGSITPLSKSGLNQAERVAKRFKNIPIDIIITSNYVRAVQTATEIQKVNEAEIVQSDLFVEHKLPSLFEGKPFEDEEVKRIHKSIRDNFHDPDWHYADEENFADVLARAKRSVAYIQDIKKENVVVVTHGYFLTVLIFYILFGESADSHTFRFFRKHTDYANTGITVCDYGENNWKLFTWNDIAHLGEEK